MGRLDHDRLSDIFSEARQLPISRRRGFLDSTCAGEPELRREVEELLGCDDSASAAFDVAAQQVVPPDPRWIGPYELLEPVGEGGMAVVYRAQQHRPVKRVVAIKILKIGMDTRQFVARFELERQALAIMNHPNVARVLDAGATDAGRPYFVMDFVDGEAITSFCNRKQYTLRQRLELFIQVCEGVQHAHQKAIIHRDLKPSNVLVSEVDPGAPGLAKVIDFGVGKVISQPLAESTMATQAGQFIGTPAYMSPEQADGLIDIDTRSDVYSLGALLYELLAGATPFDSAVLGSSGYQEFRRVIVEVDPPRPSERLSSRSIDRMQIAASRKMAPDALQKQLGRELDWIPLKAMRKNPAERYATATELADDISNYLTNRPLRAGPESTLYRARKFLRRNAHGAAAAAAIVLLLIAGIIGTRWQAVRATRAQHAADAALLRAQEANAETRAVNDFLTLDVLWSAEPAVTRGDELSVRQALDNAAREVAVRFRAHPRIEAAVRNTLAGAYRTLGQLDVAMTHSQVAIDIMSRLGLSESPEGLQIINDKAMILMEKGDSAGAESLFRQTLEARRRLLGSDHPVTVESVGNLAVSLIMLGRASEAEQLVREEENFRGASDLNDINHVHPISRLGMVLQQQGKLDEAEAMIREALALSIRIGGEDHPDTLTRKFALARLLHRRGDFAQAESIMRPVLVERRRVLGDDHPDTLESIDMLATLLVDRGKFEEAKPLAVEALERSRRLPGLDESSTVSRINNLAKVQMSLGNLAAAEPLFREALEAARRIRSDEHSQTLIICTNLAFVLARRGQFDEAETLLRQTLEIQRRVLGEQHRVTVASVNNLGGLLFDQREFAEAETLFRTSLEGRRRLYGPAHPETMAGLSNLGRALRAQDRHAEAEPVFAELYRSSREVQLPPRQAALFISHWGPCLAQLGRFQEAEAPLREAYKRLTATGQTRGDHMQRVLSALVEVCVQTNRPEEADKWRAELDKIQPATSPTTKAS